jgi:hypothetical protein
LIPSRYLIDILPLILRRHLVMVLFHDHFDEATILSDSQNTDSSMSFNLRQLAVDSMFAQSRRSLTNDFVSEHGLKSMLAIPRVPIPRVLRDFV